MYSKYLSGYITDENVAPQLEHKIDRLIRYIEKLESLVDVNKEIELLDIHNAMENVLETISSKHYKMKFIKLRGGDNKNETIS